MMIMGSFKGMKLGGMIKKIKVRDFILSNKLDFEEIHETSLLRCLFILFHFL